MKATSDHDLLNGCFPGDRLMFDDFAIWMYKRQASCVHCRVRPDLNPLSQIQIQIVQFNPKQLLHGKLHYITSMIHPNQDPRLSAFNSAGKLFHITSWELRGLFPQNMLLLKKSMHLMVALGKIQSTPVKKIQQAAIFFWLSKWHLLS